MNKTDRFSQIIEDVGLDGQDIEQGPDALLETLETEEEAVQTLKKEEIAVNKYAGQIEKLTLKINQKKLKDTWSYL